MPVIYTDREISQLINERKTLPNDWESAIYVADYLKLRGEVNDFRMYVSNHHDFDIRDSSSNIQDFSVGLGVVHPLTTRLFMLLRYDGITSHHDNKIEGTSITGFHIHQATERYQKRGRHETSFAIETDSYTNIHEAIQCLISDANIIEPENTQQPNLFN